MSQVSSEHNKGTYYVYLSVRRYLKIEKIEKVVEDPDGFLSFTQILNNGESRSVYTVSKNIVSYYYRVDDDMETRIQESNYHRTILNEYYSQGEEEQENDRGIIIR